MIVLPETFPFEGGEKPIRFISLRFVFTRLDSIYVHYIDPSDERIRRRQAGPFMQTLQVMLILLLLPLFGATGTALLHPGAPPWSHKPLPEGHVNQATIDRWHTEILWVDSRSREAYEAGHIPGAALLNELEWEDLLPSFFDRLAELNNPRIVVYCSVLRCLDSEQVAQRLRTEVGLKDVYVLSGGWENWKINAHS